MSSDFMKHTPSGRFRGANGARVTRQLFWDNIIELPADLRTFEPLYTLHHDKPGLVNFRRVYVELADPTGWKISQRLLEDYAHWQQLLKCSWFREAKEAWDAELDAKLSSEGMDAIRLYAEGVEGVPASTTLAAAKYLADKSYRKQPKSDSPGRGRPSKAEVAGRLAQEAADATDLAADLARIRAAK